MRKHLYLVIIVILLSLLTPVVHADLASWDWRFVTGSEYQGGTIAWFGTNPAASDGYDPAMSDGWAPVDRVISSGQGQVGTYHGSNIEGSTWAGPLGFYWYDYRAPITLTAGQSKTWTMYVWADSKFPMEATYMEFGWAYRSPDYSPLNYFHFTVTLKFKPDGITGGPAAGTVWDLSLHPSSWVDLPVFRTANGLEGYVFDFTATAVPEPSSLAALALALGLAPLAAAGMRKKR